jgi:hypothetical protein
LLPMESTGRWRGQLGLAKPRAGAYPEFPSVSMTSPNPDYTPKLGREGAGFLLAIN